MYEEVKSEFIKNKIKETRWEDRGYIDDLLKIEQHALGKLWGLWSGYIAKELESNYPKEWEIIYKEVNPKGWEARMKREREYEEKKRIEDEERERRKNEEYERNRREWIEMGGKI